MYYQQNQSPRGLPFTYLVVCKSTNQAYYGSRTARDCSPRDLWSTYFTSSKRVHSLIERYGKDNFLIQVRKTFATESEAIEWESTVIRRLNIGRKKHLWLNRRITQTKYIWDDALRSKLSDSMKGRVPWNKGRKTGPEPESTRQKKRNAHLGKKLSPDHTIAISKSTTGRRPWNKGIQHGSFLTSEGRSKIAESNKRRALGTN